MASIVNRVLTGETIASICRDTGLHRETILKHLQRSGKDRPPMQPKRTTAEILQRIVEKRAEPPQPAPVHVAHVVSIPTNATVLAIPDLHTPFHHIDALAFLVSVRDKYKPDVVINLGDEIDAHALSRFPKDPDGFSAGHEINKAIEALIPFYKEFPEVLVCESNHTTRGHKLSFQAGLPASFLKHISTILNAPNGWVWGSRWEVDGVVYKHGTGRSGENAHKAHAKASGKSTVIGHIHAHSGVAYLAPRWFAVNAGCLIDQNAYCFAYAKEMEPNIQLGCAVIHKGESAKFIPMITDAAGRWVGRL